MLAIRKEFRFEAAHRLPGHKGKCSNLHGHSYRVVFWIDGEVETSGSSEGMVVDFSDLSALVAPHLENFDHCVILSPRDQDLADVLSDRFKIKVLRFPVEPTAENFAEYFAKFLNGTLQQTSFRLSCYRVEVWESATAAAVWERAR